MAITVDSARISDLQPQFGSGFEADAAAASRYFAAGQALIGALPPRPRRTPDEQASAEEIHARLRNTRVAFLRRHVSMLYERLTDGMSRFVRIEELVYSAARLVPGLVPTPEQVLA